MDDSDPSQDMIRVAFFTQAAVTAADAIRRTADKIGENLILLVQVNADPTKLAELAGFPSSTADEKIVCETAVGYIRGIKKQIPSLKIAVENIEKMLEQAEAAWTKRSNSKEKS